MALKCIWLWGYTCFSSGEFGEKHYFSDFPLSEIKLFAMYRALQEPVDISELGVLQDALHQTEGSAFPQATQPMLLYAKD